MYVIHIIVYIFVVEKVKKIVRKPPKKRSKKFLLQRKTKLERHFALKGATYPAIYQQAIDHTGTIERTNP